VADEQKAALKKVAGVSGGKDECQVRLKGRERVYWMGTEAKYTVMVSKRHCSQTFSTYLGGWEGRRPVRRGCGAQPHDFFFDDFDFWKKCLGLEIKNSWNYRISKSWDLRDRETRLFGAVSSRGKD